MRAFERGDQVTVEVGGEVGEDMEQVAHREGDRELRVSEATGGDDGSGGEVMRNDEWVALCLRSYAALVSFMAGFLR